MAQQGQDPQGFPKLDIKAARALNPHTRTIQIQSVLGGSAPLQYFPARDEFSDSFGIDPSLPIADSNTGLAQTATGFLRPSYLNSGTPFLSATVAPIFYMVQDPKGGTTWAISTDGYFSATNTDASGFTTLTGPTATSGYGRGMEYYDNYIYTTFGTDISRYGPLDSAGPTWTVNYWTSTLSKAALTDTVYPGTGAVGSGVGLPIFPNHYLHRHSDGKLYIGDVVGNQGTLHVISTTKTAVEGDTDAGSVSGKLTFGYGLWPTAIESYGSSLAIALYEGSNENSGQSPNGAKRAKLAFWDTTSQNFNSITWVEFPDDFITALKNIDGTLYIASGNAGCAGYRISRYIGGSSFEDVLVRYDGTSPFPGALDGDTSRLVFATSAQYLGDPIQNASVISIGLGFKGTQNKVFNLGGWLPQSVFNATATAVLLAHSSVGVLRKQIFAAATSNSGALATRIISTPDPGVTPNYSNINNSTSCTRKWRSQYYNIGQPFKITKIRFPFPQTIAANMIVTPVIYTDETAGLTYTGGASNGLAIINNSNYSGKRNIVMRPQGLTGDHSFQLELQWTGSALCVVGLPITIEYELIPD